VSGGACGGGRAEAQRDDPEIQNLSRLITDDIGLTALSLGFARSTLFRRGDTITGVRAAMAHFGTMNVVCIPAAAPLREAIRGPSPAFLTAFWSRLRQPGRRFAGSQAPAG
jgi:HD-like signal output (HDOD) protein